MKALLVTSAVTFVPRNYDDFVLSLADDPRIAGLIIVDNRSLSVLLSGLVLVLTGAAPRLGVQLIYNSIFPGIKKRQDIFLQNSKSAWVQKDLNSIECLEKIKDFSPDLIVNARTRTIFGRELLSIPRWGCLNIHHGLLPDQRGLMCDFWAHLSREPAGYSVHQMTEKIDQGAIVEVVSLPCDHKNYLEFIGQGSLFEAKTVSNTLQIVEQQKQVVGFENVRSEKTCYRRNPKLRDFYKLRFRGTKI